ncbi:MAG: hypothetical protein AAFX04_13170 [Pseudomonadota bacterium]
MPKKTTYRPVGTVWKEETVKEDGIPPWGWIVMILIGLAMLGQCSG